MQKFTHDFLLNEKIKIYQPKEGYRASSDSVFLASLVGKLKEGENVLDVGAGTGAISLCLARRFPKNKIVGLEIQPDFVTLANKSAIANKFQNLTYFEADIRKKNNVLKDTSFDHVLTNPPYYDGEQCSPNVGKSIARNMKDFSLKGWLNFCLKCLKPKGWLYLIHRPEALTDILTTLQGKAGNIKLIALYSKSGQNAKRVMICAQKSSRAPLQILPTFRTHTQNGTFTVAAKAILRDGEPFFVINNISSETKG